MRVTGLDHIVLRVADPMAVLAWYRDVLGLEPERLAEFERGEVPFPSVRVDAGTVIDLVELPVGGEAPAPGAGGGNLDHFCLVVDGADLDALAGDPALDVLGGPRALWGARGVGRAVYVRDPAGNVVELRSYGDGVSGAGGVGAGR